MNPRWLTVDATQNVRVQVYQLGQSPSMPSNPAASIMVEVRGSTSGVLEGQDQIQYRAIAQAGQYQVRANFNDGGQPISFDFGYGKTQLLVGGFGFSYFAGVRIATETTELSGLTVGVNLIWPTSRDKAEWELLGRDVGEPLQNSTGINLVFDPVMFVGELSRDGNKGIATDLNNYFDRVGLSAEVLHDLRFTDKISPLGREAVIAEVVAERIGLRDNWNASGTGISDYARYSDPAGPNDWQSDYLQQAKTSDATTRSDYARYSDVMGPNTPLPSTYADGGGVQFGNGGITANGVTKTNIKVIVPSTGTSDYSRYSDPMGPNQPFPSSIGSVAGIGTKVGAGVTTTTRVATAGTTHGGAREPVLLDLDGDGLEITQLGASNTFFDVVGDGKQHRTAWAGVGDGVLVFDVNDDGIISARNEIDFTQWDPTAQTDMQALLSVFDTNDNDKLDSGDAQWALFKVLVTKEDGTTELKTLAELDIESIGLISNHQEIALADGSKITGTTVFERTSGPDGTAGDASLAFDANGYVIAEEPPVTVGTDTVLTRIATRPDGSMAGKTVLTVTSDGLTRTTTFDDDGDGVFDRKIVDATEVDAPAAGGRTRTVTIYSDGEGTIVAHREVTVTDGDDGSVTITRYRGENEPVYQVETQVRATGALTVTITNLNPDGTTHDASSTTTTDDGESKSTAVDRTGDGVEEATRIQDTDTSVDGNTRTEVVSNYAGDGISAAQLVHQTTTVTTRTTTGLERTITANLDGLGGVDLTTHSLLEQNLDGSTITTVTRTNADNSFRDEVRTELSEDGYHRKTYSNLDSDADDERVVHDDSTLAGGETTRVVQTFAGDETTLLSKTTAIWSAGGIERETYVDTDGDGQNDQTDVVVLDGTDIVETISQRSLDGSKLLSETKITTTDGGLTRTTETNLDGDLDVDRVEIRSTVLNPGDGSSTTMVQSLTGGASPTQIGKVVTWTSEDGLHQTVDTYVGTATVVSGRIETIRSTGLADETITTVTTYAGSTLEEVGHATTVTTADRLQTTVSSYFGAFTSPQHVLATVEASDGKRTQTESTYSPDGTTLLSQTVSVVEATSAKDGFVTIVRSNDDGIGGIDHAVRTTQTLLASGEVQVVTATFAGDAGDELVGKVTETTSANGRTITRFSDRDGDGTNDAKTVIATTLLADGSTVQSTTHSTTNGATQTGKTTVAVADDRMLTTSSTFYDSDATADRVTTDKTEIATDGFATETIETKSANGSVLVRDIFTTTANGRVTKHATNYNGDAGNDAEVIRTVEGDGDVVTLGRTWDNIGALTSSSNQTDTLTHGASGADTTIESETVFQRFGTFAVMRTTEEETVFKADGDRRETTTITTGSLAETATVTSKANGLRVETSWTGGIANRSIVEMTAHNTNGSRPVTISDTVGGAPTPHILTTIDTSADGRQTTTTEQIDGSGGRKMTTVKTLHDDGHVTIDAMDGNVVSATPRNYGSVSGRYEWISANGLERRIDFDSNGNGIIDGAVDSKIVDTTQLQIGGSRLETVTYTKNGSSDVARTLTSADGLTKTTQWNNSGTALPVDPATAGAMSEKTFRDFNETTSAESITRRTQDSVGDRTIVTTTAANGLSTSQTLSMDNPFTGSGSISGTLTRTVEYLTSGAIRATRTGSNLDGQGLSSSAIEETTSADGRTRTTKVNVDGVGGYEATLTESVATYADGSTVTAWTRKNASNVVEASSTKLVELDGRHTILQVNRDNDQFVDHEEESTLHLDGSTTRTIVEKEGGAVVSLLRSTLTADGTKLTSFRNFGSDGQDDLRIDHTWLRKADGSLVETIETYAISTESTSGVTIPQEQVLKQRAVTTTSADGRTIVSLINVDGVGDADDETVTTTIRADGSKLTIIEDDEQARASQGVIGDAHWLSKLAPTAVVAAKTEILESADGLQKTLKADYDDDGTFDHYETWVTRLDGSQVATVKDVDADGTTVATGTITVSADGLTTTIREFYGTEDTDLDREDVSKVRADGSKLRTTTDYNSDGSLGLKVVIDVAADGATSHYTADGGALSEVLYGGSGNDTLRGGDGNDLYLYGRSSGDDLIYESGTGNGGNDVIQFGPDITADQLSFKLINNSVDLRITVTGAFGGVLTIQEWNDVAGDHQVERLALSDGTVLSIANARINTQGTDSDDTLTMGNYGYGVPYIVQGYDGNDSITTFDGADILLGGADNDALNGQNGNDFLSGGEDYDTLTGGNGDDTLLGGDHADTLNGGAGDDRLLGGKGGDSLSGSDGRDYLSGDDADDRLDGGTGDDTLRGGIGGDSLIGGTGDDVYYFYRTWGSDTINDAGSDDDLPSQPTHESNAGDKLVFSGIAVDDLVFDLNALNSMVIGVLPTNATSGAPEDLADRVYIKNWTTAANRLETIAVSGASFRVKSIADGQNGTSGANTIDAANATVGILLSGTAGADWLSGTSSGDVLVGGVDNDTLRGDTGNDYLFGGAGVDSANGDAGDDYVYGGAGNDSVIGGDGNDHLFGGLDDDRFYGGEGNDSFYYSRGEGSDTIRVSGGGIDTLRLGSGIEIRDLTGSGDEGDNLIFTLDDGETILLMDQRLAVSGGDGYLEKIRFSWGLTIDVTTLRYARTGTDAANSWDLQVHGYGDWVNAGGGSDTLLGGSGNDIIIGGEGDDSLSGNDGNDTYAFYLGDGHDTIVDGAGSDSIVFGEGVTADDVGIKSYGADLWIVIYNHETPGATSVNSFADYMKIVGWSTTANRIEYLRFMDGSSVKLSEYIGGGLYGTGNDVVDYTTTTNRYWINAGSGNDTVKGGANGDRIVGATGDDTLIGSKDIDNIWMWGWDESYGDRAGGDYIDGGAGNDVITVFYGANTLVGGEGNDILTGGWADGTADGDWMDGGAGNDTIYYYGNDTIFGGIGNDTIIRNDLNTAGSIVVFRAGDGNDTIRRVVDAGTTLQNDILEVQGYDRYDIWFSKTDSNHDLTVRFLGSKDTVVFDNYFDHPYNHFGTIYAGGWTLADAQIAALVAAMASGDPNDGTDGVGIISSTLPQTIRDAIDGAWV